MAPVETFLWSALGAIVVIGVLRPLLWWVLLSLSLWIGRNTLPPKWGERIFGRYWYPSKSPSISAMDRGTMPRPSRPPTPDETDGLPRSPFDR